MPDGEMKSSELLSPGGQPALGATHAENVGIHQPTWGEQNPGEAAAALIRASAAGRAELSSMIGVPDPIEDYFSKMAAMPDGLNRLQNFLEVQQRANLAETAVIAIKNTPGLTFGEMKRVVAAIEAGQGKGKSVEQLVREVRQPASLSLEPQQRPLSVDWRDALLPIIRGELSRAEQRWSSLELSTLQNIKDQIKEALSSWGIDGNWPNKGGLRSIQPESALYYLRALDEEIQRKEQFNATRLIGERIDKMGFREHIEKVKSRLHLSSDAEAILVLQEKEREARMLLRNPPYELFPPDLHDSLISLIRSRGNGG